MYNLFIFTTKNAGNHLLALGPRKAVEKQVTPAYTGGRLPVLFFDNLNFLILLIHSFCFVVSRYLTDADLRKVFSGIHR